MIRTRVPPSPSSLGLAEEQRHVISAWEVTALGRSMPALTSGADLSPGLDIAVCTYQRGCDLERFLDSLPGQVRRPETLIIVDASRDSATEMMLAGRRDLSLMADMVQYFRVDGPLRGLTRQRNFALRRATHERITFFDDDVVLTPDCLLELEKPLLDGRGRVVGAGAYILNSPIEAPRGWHWRRRLGIVPHLRPGVYCRSGVSLPWAFMTPTEDVLDGDWLPGCCMMWKTDIARHVGFHDVFPGYAQGEDLDFSLAMRRHGRLVLAGAAHVEHLQSPAGRPDPYNLGYMAIYNRYHIHRRGLPDRTWRDVAWFVYAWIADTALLACHLCHPSRSWSVLRQLFGRAVATWHLLCRR